MKTTTRKSTDHLALEFKVEAKDDGDRTFEGILSTSDLDHGNFLFRDIVHPGAFKRTLANFKASSRPYIPLLDNHDRYSIFSVLGHLTDAEERTNGDGMKLWTRWQLIDGEDGQKVLDRLRPDSVRKMSMGYEPVLWDFEHDEESGDVIRHLREVKLLEGSLVVFPMNDHAETLHETVKALAGHVDQAALDRLVADCHGDGVCITDVKRRAAALLKGPPATDPEDPSAPDPNAPAVVPDEKRTDMRGAASALLARNLIRRSESWNRSIRTQ